MNSNLLSIDFLQGNQKILLSFMGLDHRPVDMGEFIMAKDEMLITSGVVNCIAGAALLQNGELFLFHTRGDEIEGELLKVLLTNRIQKGVIGGCIWLPDTMQIIAENQGLNVIDMPQDDRGIFDFHVVYDPETKNVFYGYLNKDDDYWLERQVYESGQYMFD